jgi:putative protease
VDERGTHFLCKYKTLPNDELELVAPLDAKIELVDNEIGTTYERDGRVYMKLKKLVAENRKVWDEVHSGNLNPITLPIKLPPYTFLRIPASAEMGTYPKA